MVAYARKMLIIQNKKISKLKKVNLSSEKLLENS